MEALSLIVGVSGLGFGLAAVLQMRADRAKDALKRQQAPWAYPPPPARILELQSQRKRLVMKHQAVRSVDKRIRDLRHDLLREEIAR